MENKSNPKTIGFSGALTLIFIVLKLTGKITWNWGWVMSPMLIAILIEVIIVTVVTIIKIRS